MSAAPEVSFPDPAEAIAKTDRAIALSGVGKTAERHLRVVSDHVVSSGPVVKVAPDKTASDEAISKRQLAAPTIEMPAIADEIIDDEISVPSTASESMATTSPILGSGAEPAAAPTSEIASSKSGINETSEKTGLSNSSKIRYRNFILVGVVVGIAAAGILIVGLPGDAIAGQWVAFGYLSVFFGIVCGILGGLLAVLTDKKGVQR